MDRLATEKHLKQNKEIIRINQLQSNRIASLETEVTRLLSENMQLRTKVIQLTHQQDLSAQKTQLERKIREIHRLVRGLGSSSSLNASPIVPLIMRKSPKKVNLRDISPEPSPGSLSLNFISTRSKPRSLVGPSRAMHVDVNDVVIGDARVDDADTAAVASQTPETTRQERKEIRQRQKAREARRSSRRISRSSDEMIPLPSSEFLAETPALGSPCRHPSTVARCHVEGTERSPGRTAHSLNRLEDAPSYNSKRAIAEKSCHQLRRSDDGDKENDPLQRQTTAAIRFLHSSPVKSRTALNVIADPLPSLNIPIRHLQPPPKALNEVVEVKSEPMSPSFEAMVPAADADSAPHTEGVRSRRGKTVNYAEPSLRAKMRRTETLGADKRRKSTYRSMHSQEPSGQRSAMIEEDS